MYLPTLERVFLTEHFWSFHVDLIRSFFRKLISGIREIYKYIGAPRCQYYVSPPASVSFANEDSRTESNLHNASVVYGP